MMRMVAEMEMMKERLSKLLLGEDMSGCGNGVSTALTISNAITNLCGWYIIHLFIYYFIWGSIRVKSVQSCLFASFQWSSNPLWPTLASGTHTPGEESHVEKRDGVSSQRHWSHCRVGTFFADVLWWEQARGKPNYGFSLRPTHASSKLSVRT